MSIDEDDDIPEEEEIPDEYVTDPYEDDVE
jgi:hypothetical protein